MPIVEPEVLMDGDHTIERSLRRDVANAARGVHRASRPARPLRGHAAEAEHGALGLRVPGSGQAPTRSPQRRIRCFRRHVPAAVPGIVFLSGGQSDEDATAHLNAMNRLGPHPWQLSFSYGRALQAPALKAWGGDPANVAAAQAAYLHRARMNGLARSGDYSPELETEVAA